MGSRDVCHPHYGRLDGVPRDRPIPTEDTVGKGFSGLKKTQKNVLRF